MRLIRLFKKDLAKEASTWVDNQLITVDQARAICRHYDIDYDEIRSGSATYQVLIVLGFLFVGLSLITLIAGNWETIPRAVRMGGLLLLTAGTHSLALRMHQSGRVPAAIGLFFLGNLFYGSSIILIAQIYHLGENMADGVFLWAFGTLPFAVLLCNTWLMSFSGLLALVWWFVEFQTGFLAPVFFAAAFPVFLLAMIFVLARAQASTLLFLMFVISLGLWFETLLSLVWTDGRGRLEFSAEQALVGLALFILAYASSYWLHSKEAAKAKDYGVVLSLWSLRFALLSMLVLSYLAPWERLLGADWSHQTSMWIIVAAVLGLALWIGWKSGRLPILLSITVPCGAVMIAVVTLQTADSAIYFQKRGLRMPAFAPRACQFITGFIRTQESELS